MIPEWQLATLIVALMFAAVFHGLDVRRARRPRTAFRHIPYGASAMRPVPTYVCGICHAGAYEDCDAGLHS